MQFKFNNLIIKILTKLFKNVKKILSIFIKNRFKKYGRLDSGLNNDHVKTIDIIKIYAILIY